MKRQDKRYCLTCQLLNQIWLFYLKNQFKWLQSNCFELKKLHCQSNNHRLNPKYAFKCKMAIFNSKLVILLLNNAHCIEFVLVKWIGHQWLDGIFDRSLFRYDYFWCMNRFWSIHQCLLIVIFWLLFLCHLLPACSTLLLNIPIFSLSKTFILKFSFAFKNWHFWSGQNLKLQRVARDLKRRFKIYSHIPINISSKL